MGSLATKDKQTHPGDQLKKLGQSEMYGWDSVGQQWVRLALSPSGEIIVIVDPSPGTVITTPASTVVPAGGTAPLPVPPADTRSMTIQLVGPSGGLIKIREVGGIAGTGATCVLYQSSTYGGVDGAIAALEVQDVSSPAVGATVMIQFQRD